MNGRARQRGRNRHVRSSLPYQNRGWFNDLNGLGQGGGHGRELVPDLFRRHVLQERSHGGVLFSRVVQIRAKA